MKVGLVVICGSGQAGTLTHINGDAVEVLLRSGEIWTGPSSQVREPQSAEDLAAAPVTVERPEPKRKKERK